MRSFRNLFVFFLLILLMVFLSAAVYLQVEGKNLLVTALSAALRHPVTVKEVNFQLPLGLLLEDLTVEDVLTAKEVRVQFYPLGLLKGGLHFNEISLLEPHLNPIPLSPEQISPSQPQANSPPEAVIGTTRPGLSSRGEPLGQQAIFIDKLEVLNGVFEVVYKASEKDIPIVLNNVSCVVENLFLPVKPAKTLFHLNARLSQNELPALAGAVEAFGWADLVAKDMNAKVKLSDKDRPNSLDADIVSVKNDMTVKGRVNLSGESFKSLSQGRSEDGSSVQNVIAGVLGQAGLDVGLDFSFKTKMDSFEISNVSFSGSVTANSVAQ